MMSRTHIAYAMFVLALVCAFLFIWDAASLPASDPFR